MCRCEDYGIGELSLVIYNDEGLYNMRHSLTRELLEDLGVTHTEEQWENFLEDLADEDE